MKKSILGFFIVTVIFLQSGCTPNEEVNEVAVDTEYRLVFEGEGGDNKTIEEIQQLLNISLSNQVLILLISMSTIIILLATVLPIWSILRLEPKRVLE